MGWGAFIYNVELFYNFVLCTYILQLSQTITAAKKGQNLPTMRLGDLAAEQAEGDSEEEVLEPPPDVEDNQLPPVRGPRRRKRPAEALGRNPEADAIDDPDAPDRQTRLLTTQRMEQRLDRLLRLDPNPVQAEKTSWGLWLGAVAANVPDDRFPEFMNRTWALCAEFGTRWASTRPSRLSSSSTQQNPAAAQSSYQADYTSPSAFRGSYQSSTQPGTSTQGGQYGGQYNQWSQPSNLTYTQLQTPRPAQGTTPTGMNTGGASLGVSGLSLDSSSMGQCMGMSLTMSPTALAQGVDINQQQ